MRKNKPKYYDVSNDNKIVATSQIQKQKLMSRSPKNMEAVTISIDDVDEVTPAKLTPLHLAQ